MIGESVHVIQTLLSSFAKVLPGVDGVIAPAGVPRFGGGPGGCEWVPAVVRGEGAMASPRGGPDSNFKRNMIRL